MAAHIEMSDTRIDIPWKHAHGFRGSSKWAKPLLVAKSNKAGRADQGNTIKANEFMDESDVLEAKMEVIADMVRQSKYCVAYTGAGLSKASGIPDYATQAEDSVVAVAEIEDSFLAKPTYAHLVIAAMERAGYIKNYVQQNHDGLPQKAGFPQEKINEIHGAWFDPSNPVVQFDGSLRGDLFKWMLQAEKKADMCLCLGTSLSGMNADRMATTPAKKSLKDEALGTVIINLQQTGLDDKCAVRVWAKLDDAFRILARLLDLDVQPAPAFAPSATDVFTVPYSESGELDEECAMTLDLRRGQAVKIANPLACNKGQKGQVRGKDDEGNYLVYIEGEGVMVLGRWWADVAQRGAVEQLPVINLKPKIVPASSREESTEESTPSASRSSREPSREVPSRPSERSETTGRGGCCAPAADAGPALPPFIRIVQSHRTVEGENSHEWGLRLEDGAETFVKSVTWTLHPTFCPDFVECDKPPFRVERTGWGTFDVKATVTLRSRYGGRELRGHHELVFGRNSDHIAVTDVSTE